MGTPNEWFMLRRAARYLVEGLLSSHAYWEHVEEFTSVHDAVRILKECAAQMPDKVEKKRDFWASYFERI